MSKCNIQECQSKAGFKMMNYYKQYTYVKKLLCCSAFLYSYLGTVHKGRHLLLGGEGVHQMVPQSDMEGGRGLAKGDVTSKCPKNEQIFPQESAASHKFV